MDAITSENNKEYNEKWPFIPDHPYQILIIGGSGLKYVGIKYCNAPNAFIECSNTMDDVYENIDDYNPNRQRKISIKFDDIIAYITSIKKLQVIIKELFVRCRKLNISLAFITQSYFSVPKDVRLNSTHYLIMKSTTEKNYKIMQLIILQILITKIL